MGKGKKMLMGPGLRAKRAKKKFPGQTGRTRTMSERCHQHLQCSVEHFLQISKVQVTAHLFKESSKLVAPRKSF